MKANYRTSVVHRDGQPVKRHEVHIVHAVGGLVLEVISELTAQALCSVLNEETQLLAASVIPEPIVRMVRV